MEQYQHHNFSTKVFENWYFTRNIHYVEIEAAYAVLFVIAKNNVLTIVTISKPHFVN